VFDLFSEEEKSLLCLKRQRIGNDD